MVVCSSSVTTSIGKGHTIPIDTILATDINTIASIKIDRVVYSRCVGLNSPAEETIAGMRDDVNCQQDRALFIGDRCG
jgi:hypothetical protein